MKHLLLLFILNFYCLVSYTNSKDLTRQNPIVKTIILKGVSGKHHFFEPREIKFFTGNLYKLIIKNTSDSKHYFSSDSFSKAIFTRKIQININNKKLAEIKGLINEVEVWPNHEIEWWFVPVKTGYFDDLNCKVKDKKNNITHAKMGMKGVIIIE